MLQLNIYRILLVVLGCLFLMQAHGQYQQYSISNLSLESGLSESSVRDIIQDSKGFLWIGTLDGLNRYDGYNFEVFRHNPQDSATISDNSINTVYEDSKGNIWVGTQNGLNKYNRANNSFTAFYHNDSIHTSLSSNNVFDIYEDHKGRMWVLTAQSLELYVPANDEFQHYEYTTSNFSRIGSYYFFDLVQGPKGLLWFSSYKGIYAFNPEERQFEVYTPEQYQGFSDAFVRRLHLTNSNDFLLGTNKGVIEFNPGQEVFKTYKPSDYGFSEGHDVINSVFHFSNGMYGIGTSAGILFFNKNSGTFSSSYQNIGKPWTGFIASSYEKDNSGIIWLGTFQDGLLKIAPNRKKFHLLNKTTHPDLSEETIASVYVEDDNLWIGTWGTGLNLLDRKSEEIRVFQSDDERYGFNNDYIHEIMVDSKNRMWLGTRNGPGIFDRENFHYTPLAEQKLDYRSSGLSNARIFNIYEDSKNRIWFPSNQGLYKLHNDSLSRFFFPDSLDIESSLIYVVYESRNFDFLWFGTEAGLFKLDVHSLKLLNDFRAGDCEKCLSNNSVLSIHETADGTLWAGTKAGLNKISQKEDTTAYYIQANTNFSNDNIYNILEDQNNHLWLSTNHGLIKFDPETETAINYAQSDGLQGFEFNYGACFKDESGMMYFGGVSGLNSFYPDSIRQNQNLPRLLFNKAELYMKNKTIVKPLINKEKLVIPSDVYGFNIEFLALEYTFPEKNQYRYKMSGITEGWRKLDTKHSVSFSRLSPGTYTLSFIGSNNDLKWNKQEQSIEIVVETSIFKTVYAYIFYGIVVLLVIFWILSYRTQKLRESNQALKERQKAHIKIENQKEELAVKNKNITDSINYARRIIDAMMPTEKAFQKILPESFVLSLPKDIVSGDFYWIAQKNDKIFLAAVDCTGHGIPGAFMSIIGFDLLRNIIEIEGIEEPAEILNRLDDGVAETFMSAEDMELSDGMDISFCVIDTQMKFLEFAGAMNPLYLLRDNNIVEFKGDRHSVGNKEKEDNKHFKNQRIPLKEGDVIYLFSDGFPDQFGGPKGKKFKYRRLRHLLLTIHKLPFERQKSMLLKSIQQWKRDLDQVDDILFIGVKPLQESNK